MYLNLIFFFWLSSFCASDNFALPSTSSFPSQVPKGPFLLTNEQLVALNPEILPEQLNAFHEAAQELTHYKDMEYIKGLYDLLSPEMQKKLSLVTQKVCTLEDVSLKNCQKLGILPGLIAGTKKQIEEQIVYELQILKTHVDEVITGLNKDLKKAADKNRKLRQENEDSREKLRDNYLFDKIRIDMLFILLKGVGGAILLLFIIHRLPRYVLGR